MRDYDPLDWYWLADGGRVFASKRCAAVDKTDAGFLERQEEGAFTRWPVDASGAQTDAALDDVLRAYGLSTRGAVRLATGYGLVSALSDDEVAALGKVKPKDQHLFGKRDGAWPEDNPKIGRIATALGMTPKAWFDRALGVAG